MSDETGFLTQTDRAFLTGEKEYTGPNAKQRRYQRREAIASRTRQAFRDFSLLFEVLDERERDRVFDPPREEGFAEGEFITPALWDTIAFLYHSLEGDKGRNPRMVSDRSCMTRFEDVLRTGVQRGEQARHPSDAAIFVGVDFDVDVTEVEQNGIQWELLLDGLADRNVNSIDETQLRRAMAIATNPTDRLRELADLIEERRGGQRYMKKFDKGWHEPEDLADAAPPLRELIDEAHGELNDE